jgi:multiple sugar transport system ATP-binding protein
MSSLVVVAMLIVRDLVKSFGSHLVLQGVSLEVVEGEYFTVIGPSGEGKSTFLNIVAGLLRPSRGEVYIGGVLVEDSGRVHVPPEKRGVGYVFQSYALYPHMTAFDNIAFPLKMAKWPRDQIRRAVEEVAELLGIREHLGKKPHQLSGGQRQRVAVARALVKRPKLLLMDEPFSNIDPAFREEVRVEIRRVVKSLGTTTVMVTHDREEAFSLSDRIAVLRRGRFLQVGPPAEVYMSPCCVEVARFLGLNVVPAGGRWLVFRPEDVELDGGDLQGEVLGVEYRARYWMAYVKIDGAVVKAALPEPPKQGAPARLSLRRAVELHE